MLNLKYQKVLWSRTFSNDYRWMFRPDNLTSIELSLLQTILNFYIQDYRNYFSKQLENPLLLLDFSKAFVVVRCIKTAHVDFSTTDIYALEGVCVSHINKRLFWYGLPQLFARSKFESLLHIWDELKFEEVNKLEEEVAEAEVELSVEAILGDSAYITHKNTEETLKKILNDKVLIFDVDQFENLLAAINNSDVPFFQFVFASSYRIYSTLKHTQTSSDIDKINKAKDKNLLQISTSSNPEKVVVVVGEKMHQSMPSASKNYSQMQLKQGVLMFIIKLLGLNR